MEESKHTVTVQQVAKRFAVSLRTVHHWLHQGRTIGGILSYEKLNPDHRNSPYVIIAKPEFFDKRKKLTVESSDEEADYLK